jgi:hypothetical protein
MEEEEIVRASSAGILETKESEEADFFISRIDSDLPFITNRKNSEELSTVTSDLLQYFCSIRLILLPQSLLEFVARLDELCNFQLFNDYRKICRSRHYQSKSDKTSRNCILLGRKQATC